MACPRVGSIDCYCPDFGERYNVPKVATLHTLIRDLFDDHVNYTVLFMRASIFEDGDSKQLETALLQNQTDIGKNLGVLPKVGEVNGKLVGDLLTEHIKLAGAAVTAAKKYYMDKTPENKAASDKASSDFIMQGDKLAAGLTSLNPMALPLDFTREAFNVHTRQVVGLALIFLDRNFDIEVPSLKAYACHMKKIADAIYLAVA